MSKMENFGKFLVLGAASAAVGYYIYRRYRAGSPLEAGGASRLVVVENSDQENFSNHEFDAGELMKEETLIDDKKDDNGLEKKDSVLIEVNDKNATPRLDELKRRFYGEEECVAINENDEKDFELDRDFDSDELNEFVNEIFFMAKKVDDKEREKRDELLQDENDGVDNEGKEGKDESCMIEDEDDDNVSYRCYDSHREYVPPEVSSDDKKVCWKKKRGKCKGLRKFFERLSCFRKAGGEE